MRKFVSLALVFVAAIAVSAVAQTNPAASQPNFGPNVYYRATQAFPIHLLESSKSRSSRVLT
jgi:hypothetical protein